MKTEKNNNSKFEIDFFELMFLAEVCIPPVPIARHVFFDRLHRDYYDNMSKEQRKEMFEHIKKNEKFDKKNESCLNFYNRFNPRNQYKLTVNYGGKIEYVEAYLHEGNYHVNKNQWVGNGYIINVD